MSRDSSLSKVSFSSLSLSLFFSFSFSFLLFLILLTLSFLIIEGTLPLFTLCTSSPGGNPNYSASVHTWYGLKYDKELRLNTHRTRLDYKTYTPDTTKWSRLSAEYGTRVCICCSQKEIQWGTHFDEMEKVLDRWKQHDYICFKLFSIFNNGLKLGLNNLKFRRFTIKNFEPVF